MNIKLISIVIPFIFGFIGCSSSELMISNPVKNITIDGNQEDWNGKLKYFEDEQVAIGFQNDEENLYLCLVSSNKSNTMEIMTLGLTVWFEPENGEETIGLQYPKQMDRIARHSQMGKSQNQNNNSDLKMTINTMMQNQGEFVLVDEDKEILYASPIGSNDGYEIKIGAVNRQFVYEAKIPIGNNSQAQMPIDIFPDEKFSIEFETGELNIEGMRKNGDMQSSNMREGGGGMRGGGDGMRGNMQEGGRPGNNRMGTKSFKLDVEVKLSK